MLRETYGCINISILWYNIYAKVLKDTGFKVNQYDRCVANKIINGKQCIIVWYVGDKNISHVDENIVTCGMGVTVPISRHDSLTH